MYILFYYLDFVFVFNLKENTLQYIFLSDNCVINKKTNIINLTFFAFFLMCFSNCDYTLQISGRYVYSQRKFQILETT